jgi:hypothetical protein
MPRANRYFLPGHVWQIAVLVHPWTSRHKHIPVQNTPLSQERVSVEVCARPQTLAPLAVRGEEALWSLRAELHRHLESHSPLGTASR